MIYLDRMVRERMDACLDRGGHFWNAPPEGQCFMCTQCDAVGALRVPAVNECPQAQALA